MEKVLLFGGSFDPIHLGHLIGARFAAETLAVDRVYLIPSLSPPHKQSVKLAAATDRLEMCRLAVAGDPRFGVSDWETCQPGPNYTLLTVRHFQEELGTATRLYWLIGMDTLGELGTWYKVSELVELCTIVTLARPGFENPDLAGLRGPLTGAQIERLSRHILKSPRIDIGATDIRARVRAGQSIRYLVPPAVERYIAERKLYQHG